jgi:hypothetical protein
VAGGTVTIEELAAGVVLFAENLSYAGRRRRKQEAGSDAVTHSKKRVSAQCQ